MGFLLFGALLVGVGWGLVRAGREDTRPRGAPVSPTRERWVERRA